jgi:trehalose 6-phosphate phosphatase
MIPCSDERIRQKIGRASSLWLFLDYDGTLANFAPTPDMILPDEALIALITALAGRPDIRVTILSGRRLAHIQALLPVPAIAKAGSYGLEMVSEDGTLIHPLQFETIRPLLDRLKQAWARLLDGRRGFYLEDKGWTLAIHAKDAAEEEAQVVLEQAQGQAQTLLDEASYDEASSHEASSYGYGGNTFRLLGGHRFLECGPHSANKKQTVERLLASGPWNEDTLLIYLGDDDKDEVAFEAIHAHGGLAIGVGDRMRDSTADCWLPSPQAARQWLANIP